MAGRSPKEGDAGREPVGPAYFTTLRIPIVRGREISESDLKSSRRVAVVNESFARYYFGDENPIGQRIGPTGAPDVLEFEVVGVAKDAVFAGVRRQNQRFWYSAYQQYSSVAQMVLYVRTVDNPLREVAAIRRAIAGMDPNVPVYDVKTLDEQMDQYLATDRMIAMSAAFFGLLAALLAGLGLYGVMSYAVATRTREIGIRMALGARRRDVFRTVMAEVGATVLAGVTVGLACAQVLGRFVAAILFNLKPADPSVLSEATLLMIAVALVAGYLPARRAARLDPMKALRHE